MTEKEALEIEKKKLSATNIYIKCDKDMNGKSNLWLLQNKENSELIISVLEEIQQYRSIGTVEECRNAMEKQNNKKYI